MASSSMMDMSLEDIIKRKKHDNVKTKITTQPNKAKGFISKPQKSSITDARNKIISKKRTQITDAREKLVEMAKQRDARQKLDLLRKQRGITHRKQASVPLPSRNSIPIRGTLARTYAGALNNKERLFTDASRQVVSQPFSRNRLLSKRQNNHQPHMQNIINVDTRSFGKTQKLKPIMRTVENDIDIIDDPMGDDHVIPKAMSSNRRANLQLRIIAHNDDVRRTESRSSTRRPTPEKDLSPPRPPSILKKRPMAALRTDKKSERAEKPALEYRIIVSNLRSTVTAGDIEELFGDIGGMVESRLVRPGTAEVMYKTVEDAQKAVDLYHNRQLDGQPMNCLLVTPRSSAPQTRNSSKPALYSTNSNVEPDISTFHKVLFSNF